MVEHFKQFIESFEIRLFVVDFNLFLSCLFGPIGLQVLNFLRTQCEQIDKLRMSFVVFLFELFVGFDQRILSGDTVCKFGD